MKTSSLLKGQLLDLLIKDGEPYSCQYVDCLLDEIINLVKQDIIRQLKEGTK